MPAEKQVLKPQIIKEELGLVESDLLADVTKLPAYITFKAKSETCLRNSPAMAPLQAAALDNLAANYVQLIGICSQEVVDAGMTTTNPSEVLAIVTEARSDSVGIGSRIGLGAIRKDNVYTLISAPVQTESGVIHPGSDYENELLHALGVVPAGESVVNCKTRLQNNPGTEVESTVIPGAGIYYNITGEMWLVQNTLNLIDGLQSQLDSAIQAKLASKM